MADDYIDYFEIAEYTDHFVTTGKPLIGTSKVVDVAALIELLAGKAEVVEGLLEKQGVKRGGNRADKATVAKAMSALQSEIRKLHSYLGSLDEDEPFDFNAFFPGQNLGPISQLKPADLLQYTNAILRAFDAPANASFAGKDARKTKLESAAGALSDAIGGKDTGRLASILGTAELVAARKDWLDHYGAAKRVVSGLLGILGRKDELRLFFKDLQVNEASAPGEAPPDAKPAPTPAPNPQ